MSRLLKNWRNPIGIGMAIVHAAVLMNVIASKQPIPPIPQSAGVCPPDVFCFSPGEGAGESLIARRVFHLHYETSVTKFLMLTDIPAMLAAGILLGPLSWVVGVSRDTGSYLAAFGWISFGSVQWWLLGTYLYLKTQSVSARK